MKKLLLTIENILLGLCLTLIIFSIPIITVTLSV
jgi:hypothetical protein